MRIDNGDVATARDLLVAAEGARLGCP